MKHDLQYDCDHRAAEPCAAPTYEETRTFKAKVTHMHCKRCGMFFGREEFLQKKQIGMQGDQFDDLYA